MTALTCAVRLLARDRPCIVCHWPIPEGRGVGYPHLRALVHGGTCSSAVDALERVFDRSPRGRWRPVREVISLADGAHCDGCAIDDDQEELP